MIGRRLAPALLAVLAAWSCGPSRTPGPAPDTGPWPVGLDEPAVLGYLAFGSADGLGTRLLQAAGEQIGWQPRGLVDDARVLLLLLDESVLGGGLALALPTDDADALAASLAACPLVESVDESRFRLVLPARHPWNFLLRAGLRLSSPGSGPGSLLDAANSLGPTVIDLELSTRGDRTLIVPSYEAGLAVRDALALLPALDEPVAPGTLSVVVGLDLERVRATFHDQVAGLEGQVRALLLGTQAAGVAGLLAGLGERRGEDAPWRSHLPVNGPFLWALLEMAGPDAIRAAQVEVSRPSNASLPDDRSAEDPLADTPDVPFDLTLRLRRAPPAADRDVLASLRPAPALDGALSLAVDAQTFPRAFAAWCRPLGELAMGTGPPADRYLDELADLLAPWAGRLVVYLPPLDPQGIRGQPLLAVALRPGRTFDATAAQAWLGRLAVAAGLDLQGTAPGLDAWLKGTPEGVPAEDGASPSPLEVWEQDEALFVTARDADADRVRSRQEAFAASRLGTPPTDAPGLRLRLGDSRLELGLRGADLVVLDAHVDLAELR